jgi:rod shape-determining protein MreD
VTARMWGRTLLVVFIALVIQATIGLDIHIAGVHPDLMLLLPIAAGMAGGAEDGAVVGFVAGMAADLLLPTPLGLSALVYCVVGCAVGVSTGEITREVWWFPALVALAASAAGVLAYAALGAVLGQEQFLKADLPILVAVVAGCNAVLSWPAMKVVSWALITGATEHARPAPTAGW